jgi:hypothetical protein
MMKENHMAKISSFVPFVGEYWTETLSNDPLILNELKRLGLSKHLRQSKSDLTMLGKNKRLVLRHLTGQAISVWEVKWISAKQHVIKCVLFINNSQKSSKDLLIEAMKLARLRWIEYQYYVDITPDVHPENFENVLLETGWSKDRVNSTYRSDSGSFWEKIDRSKYKSKKHYKN